MLGVQESLLSVAVTPRTLPSNCADENVSDTNGSLPARDTDIISTQTNKHQPYSNSKHILLADGVFWCIIHNNFSHIIHNNTQLYYNNVKKTAV